MYFAVALFIALMVIIGLAIHINEQRKYIRFLIRVNNNLSQPWDNIDG